MELNFKEYVTAFTNSQQHQEHGRFLSWNKCYEHFQKEEKEKNDSDYSALLLGFYLASWGMLRNSFLLDYTYTIHLKPIEIILDEKYKRLFKIKLAEEEDIELLFELVGKLKNYYEEAWKNSSKKGKTAHLDILVSKIILATLGLTPAYDTYVKKTLAKLNISQQFNENSYKQLLEFYKENKKFIDGFSNTYNYPPMKIIDIIFWEKGKDLYASEKKN